MAYLGASVKSPDETFPPDEILPTDELTKTGELNQTDELSPSNGISLSSKDNSSSQSGHIQNTPGTVSGLVSKRTRCVTCSSIILTRFQCTLCPHANHMLGNTKAVNHISKAHKYIEYYLHPCKECGESVAYNKYLSHYKTEHPDITAQCPMCDIPMPCYQWRLYYQHYKSHFFARVPDTESPQSTSTNAPLQESKCARCKSGNHMKYTTKCTICSMKFKTYSDTIYHVSKKHNDEILNKTYHCKFCGESVVYRSLPFHHKVSHQGTPFACPFCKDIRYRPTNACHYHSHFVEKLCIGVQTKGSQGNDEDLQSKCDICGQGFEEEIFVKAHLITEHGAKLNTELCQKCKRQIWEPEIDHHAEVCKGEEYKYKCEICTQSFKREHTLVSHHLKDHSTYDLSEIAANDVSRSNDNAFSPEKFRNQKRSRKGGEITRMICKICKRVFRYMPDINIHLEHVHSEISCQKTSPCEHCHEELTFKERCNHFARLHAEASFKCTLCEVTKENYGKLKSHYMSHFVEKVVMAKPQTPNVKNNSEGKHKCDQCGMQYKAQKTLIVHKIRMHNDKPAKEYRSKRFHCPVCGTRYGNMKWLFNHYVSHHFKRVPMKSCLKSRADFLCCHCNKISKTERDIRMHLVKNHDRVLLRGCKRSDFNKTHYRSERRKYVSSISGPRCIKRRKSPSKKGTVVELPYDKAHIEPFSDQQLCLPRSNLETESHILIRHIKEEPEWTTSSGCMDQNNEKSWSFEKLYDHSDYSHSISASVVKVEVPDEMTSMDNIHTQYKTLDHESKFRDSVTVAKIKEESNVCTEHDLERQSREHVPESRSQSESNEHTETDNCSDNSNNAIESSLGSSMSSQVHTGQIANKRRGSSVRYSGTCNLCSESFKYITKLTVHLRRKHKSHILATVGPCKHCGESLRFGEHRNHVETCHTGMPFSCLWCQELFSKWSVLDYHFLGHFFHAEEKPVVLPSRAYKEPFKCQNCDRRFKKKSAKDFHQNSVHGVPMEKVVEPKMICSMCGHMFENQLHLDRHHFSHFLLELPKAGGVNQDEVGMSYRCWLCNECFTHKARAESHITSYHKCELQSLKQPNEAGLQSIETEDTVPSNISIKVEGLDSSYEMDMQLAQSDLYQS